MSTVQLFWYGTVILTVCDIEYAEMSMSKIKTGNFAN